MIVVGIRWFGPKYGLYDEDIQSIEINLRRESSCWIYGSLKTTVYATMLILLFLVRKRDLYIDWPLRVEHGKLTRLTATLNQGFKATSSQNS